MNDMKKIVFAGVVATVAYSALVATPVMAQEPAPAALSEKATNDIGAALRTAQSGSSVDGLISELEKRAEAGDTGALRILGDVYREGRLIEKDLTKALAFYGQALDRGDKGVVTVIGDIYYRNGVELKLDPARAVEFYQQGADNGDRWALASLGDVYREGKIVAQDLPKALSLYEKAAELGNVAVYTKIGDLYYRSGEQLGLEPAKALEFYQKGVDSGDRWAMAGLGDVYREGKIVPQDVPKAVELFEKAAELGNAAVYTRLGDIYRNGANLNLDPAKAVEFYQKGADKNDSWSIVGLGDTYREGKVVPRDLSKALALYEQAVALGNNAVNTKIGDIYYRNAAELNLDPAKAVEFYEKGVASKDRWAMASLADVYREGKAVPQDLPKALSLYEEAAALGNTAVYAKIGDIYSKNGETLKLDPAKSVAFYQQGIDKGDTGAMVGLGDVYREGKVVPQDLAKALSFYEEAEKLGNMGVFTRLGDMYYRNGEALKVDPVGAVGFYQQGVDKGDSWATLSLGDVYREGKVVPQDLPKALALYEKAADLGNTAVFTKIGDIYYRYAIELKLDPALAVDFYQKGADRGDTWAMVGLGDIYREGKVVPADSKKALSYYRAAMDAGNQRAYGFVADLLLKGSAAEQKRGQSMVKAGITKGVPGVVPIWADAYLYGRGVPANPKTAVKILREASAKGDTAATLRLVQIYAEGYTGIPKNSKRAQELLSTLADQLTPDRLALERLFVVGATAMSPKQMQDFAVSLNTLPPASQASVVGRVAWRNENAFVYALQTLMKEAGVYSGPINGMLTSSTITGLHSECVKMAVASVCDAGPLSRQVRPLLSIMFRTRIGT